MIIRKFRSRDAERCSEIIYKCVETSKKTTKKDRDYLLKEYSPKKIKELVKKSDFFLVEKTNKVIGMGRLEKTKIATIYFDPKFHKRGGGTAILEKLVYLAKKRKIKKVFLESLLQSIGFYEKCGFKKIRRLNKPINSMRMEREI